MEPIAVTFDVTDALPADITSHGRLHVAGLVFVPLDRQFLSGNVTIITLLHGGSYDKRYFDIPMEGFSAARHLCDLGNIVLVLDTLGVGESASITDVQALTREVAAIANHEAVKQFESRLRAGALQSSLPPISKFVSIGGGHSMGGMVTVTQQARYGTYSGIIVLGYSAVGPDRDYREMDLPQPLYSDREGPGYVTVDRAALQSMFHHKDVPPAVRMVDDSLLVRAPLYLLDQARTPGIISADASQIMVPVFTCFGDGDAVVSAHSEPSMYRGSNDVTLFILDQSGHCHNFAQGRVKLWNRMHSWVHAMNSDGKLSQSTSCNTEGLS